MYMYIYYPHNNDNICFETISNVVHIIAGISELGEFGLRIINLTPLQGLVCSTYQDKSDSIRQLAPRQ
jgi:hypothetical protein